MSLLTKSMYSYRNKNSWFRGDDPIIFVIGAWILFRLTLFLSLKSIWCTLFHILSSIFWINVWVLFPRSLYDVCDGNHRFCEDTRSPLRPSSDLAISSCRLAFFWVPSGTTRCRHALLEMKETIRIHPIQFTKIHARVAQLFWMHSSHLITLIYINMLHKSLVASVFFWLHTWI